MIFRQVVFAMVCAVLALGSLRMANAADPALEVEAQAAVRMWLDAVMSGQPERLEAVLAPEFQLQRANGPGFNRADYIKSGVPRVTEIREISGLAATRHGDMMVVRYQLTLTSTVAGRPMEPTAPRLTVFRREGSRWLVVANANFAQIKQ